MELTPYTFPPAERCIDVCKHAHHVNGRWSCPMFENVDKVSIANPNGVECRMFERRRHGND